jgi:hypothetical protein
VGFDNQDVWCRLSLIDLDGSQDAAQLDCDVSLRHAPVHGGCLQGLGRLLIVAKGMNVDAGHKRDRKLTILWRWVTLGSCVDHFF